jgi:hypothetical protein
LKAKSLLKGIGVLCSLLAIATAPVLGQVTDGQSVFLLGGGFAKATVENAKGGFVGAQILGGKMLTNNLCLAISVAYDVVSYHKTGEFFSRLAVIPMEFEAAYFVNVGPMMQLYGSVGAGAYRTLPHLGGESIGNIDGTDIRAGGSVTVGFDYWFLLTTGVGFSFEYHLFDTPDGGDMFKYFVARVDYCLIKF